MRQSRIAGASTALVLTALVASAVPASASAAPAPGSANTCDQGCPWVMGVGDVLQVDPGLGLRRLTLTRLGDGWADFKVRGTKEPLHMRGSYVKSAGSCDSSGRCRNWGVLGIDVGAPGRVNRLAIRLDETRDGKAHLTLRSLDRAR